MTAVDTHTGEIVEPLTADEARRLTERIRLGCESIAERIDATVDLIEKARTGLADVALGYKSWTAYVEAEFAGTLPKLDRSQRQDVVQRLSDKGMSTRAIAPVVGVSDFTVRQDQVSGARNLAPAPRPATPAPPTAPPRYEPSGLDEFAPEPEPEPSTPTPLPPKITGRDGKEYTRPAPRPAPAPNPIAEAVAEVKSQPAILAAKAMERLVLVTKTVEAAGGADAILADLQGEISDAQAPLWLEFIDQAYAALDPLRAGLRRRNLRSVR